MPVLKVKKNGIWEPVSASTSVTPDYNQNDSTASDYIKNRPFYTGKGLVNTWTFDGNLDNVEHVVDPTQSNSYFVKASDIYVEPDSLLGSTITYTDFDGEEFTSALDTIQDMTDVIGVPVYVINGGLLCLPNDIPALNATAGIYAWYGVDSRYVSKIDANQPIFKTEVVHKLDTKYLPEGGFGWTEKGKTNVWEFDGNLENVEHYQVDEGQYYIRVLDTYQEPEFFVGTTCEVNFGSGIESGTFTEDMIEDVSALTGFPAYSIQDRMGINHMGIVLSQEYNGVPKGFYATYVQNDMFVQKITFTQNVIDADIIHKIDSKYLPDEVFGTDIEIDTTLSVEGQAADAKAVGDALATKQPVGDYALKEDVFSGSWNDLTDKPFGDNLENISWSVSHEFTEDSYSARVPYKGTATFELEDGKNYLVEFDGVSAEVTAYYDEDYDAVTIGEYSKVKDHWSSNWDVFIATYSGEIHIFTETTGTHTITISSVTPDIKKLDKKYLFRTSWDELSNKPIYTKSSYNLNLTWDGVIEDSDVSVEVPLEVPEGHSGSLKYCKVYPYAIGFEDGSMLRAIVDVIITDGETTNILDQNVKLAYGNIYTGDNYILISPFFVAITEPNVEIDGVVFPEKGIYFSCIEENGLKQFISKFSIPDVIQIKDEYLPQSNWNQNSAVEVDYIRNRPFYEENGESIYSGSVETNKGSSSSTIAYDVINDFDASKLIVGDWYTVIIGEKKYNCQCLKSQVPNSGVESVYLGNLYMRYYRTWTDNAQMTEEEIIQQLTALDVKDTKEPFCFSAIIDGNALLYTEEANNYNLAIIKQDIHHIHEKFIPDSIARKSDVVLSEPIKMYYEWDTNRSYDKTIFLDGGNSDRVDMLFAKISDKYYEKEFFIGKGLYVTGLNFGKFEEVSVPIISDYIETSDDLFPLNEKDYYISNILVLSSDTTIDGTVFEMGAWAFIPEPKSDFNYSRIRIGEFKKTIDPSLISGVFAKLDDIPKVQAQVQADWNQIDETAPDFIKNKPDEADALALVAELGFVEPVAADDGSIYTDENGAIYTLI